LVSAAGVYRSPRRLARAVLPALVAFAGWDIAAIHAGDWTFNPTYVTGWQLPFRLPVEELLFFAVVPLCAVLTYEAVKRVVGKDRG
jgi:lycopene cyclase domain-containing protein